MAQLTKKQSEQWKKDNDLGLSQEEKSEKRQTRAKLEIAEKLATGQDASILIDLFVEAYGYNPVETGNLEFPKWTEYLSFEQKKRIPGYYQSYRLV